MAYIQNPVIRICRGIQIHFNDINIRNEIFVFAGVFSKEYSYCRYKAGAFARVHTVRGTAESGRLIGILPPRFHFGKNEMCVVRCQNVDLQMTDVHVSSKNGESVRFEIMNGGFFTCAAL